MTSCDPELASWIRLQQTPGVGPDTARRLLSAFGLPQNIFAADLPALQAVVSARIAQALLAPPSEDTLRLIDATLAWADEPDRHILTLADDAYPRTLLEIADPPLLLHASGRLELLAASSLAVVGSRNASAQGMVNAEKFSAALSDAGLTIVSGLALGIDTAAHRGGLRGRASTVAVIGTGIDIVYPARNRELAERIMLDGCLLSEYALGTPPLPANFPRRNRLISGLARGVLVVEAAAQSGSLITARVAAEQGREVFAIPGSIHSPFSKGCHQLIRQGAKLVESAQDVLEEFGPLIGSMMSPASSATPLVTDVATRVESALLRAIGFDPVDTDTLLTRCELDIAALNAELLALEMQGLIEMLPGGMVRRFTTS
jgi:DNA processing protein